MNCEKLYRYNLGTFGETGSSLLCGGGHGSQKTDVQAGSHSSKRICINNLSYCSHYLFYINV